MPNFQDIVNSSVRSQGRDTMAPKSTNFIDVESISASQNSTPEVRSLWTEEHTANAKARRENRENREKPPKVADVADFDMDTHLKDLETEQQKEKSKWNIFK